MRPSLVTSSAWSWTIKRVEQSGAAANVAVWTPGSGKRIFIHKILVMSPSTTIVLKLTEGNDAAGTRLINHTFTANSGLVLEFPFEAPLALAADAVLKLTTDTGNVNVYVYGNEN